MLTVESGGVHHRVDPHGHLTLLSGIARVEGRRVHAAGAGRVVGLAVFAVGTALAFRAVVIRAVAVLAAVVVAVRLDVFAQVVRAHETFVADGASEALFAGVRSQMTLEFVAAREPLSAEEPIADEGPLARVPPQMGLQMGRFAVDLAASGDVTAVDVLLPQVLGGGPEAFGFLTIGTVANAAAGESSAAFGFARGSCSGARRRRGDASISGGRCGGSVSAACGRGWRGGRCSG